MKRRLNKKGIVFISLFVFVVLLFLITIVIYFSKLGAVGSGEVVDFKVSSGDTYASISGRLYDSGLIKSSFAYKLYLKTHHFDTLKAGTYELCTDMGVKGILDVLSSGKYKEDSITITFKEGINIRKIASLIEANTDNSADDVFALLEDKDYLNGLIDTYWFIDSSILNDEIYYPLEGYLFPDTYQFSVGASVSDIFKVMLDHMDSKLSSYKSQIESSSFTVHQLLTLASIVELEAGNSDDRSGVAAVFYNRIRDGWTLGSDVTTYYASRKDFNVDLYIDEINACNAYNTRGTCFTGLPVGPISSPSIQSIDGVMNPTSSEFYYFVADKNGKTYFTKTSSEHQAIISKLKSEGLWYVYE